MLRDPARPLSSRALAILAPAAAWTLAASQLAGQGRVLRPEGPGLAPPAYGRDSVAMRLEVGRFGRLDVVAERRPSDPGIASGKYYVRLNGRRIAVADDPSLMLGAPDLAGYYPGDPTVLILSTYTGGTGASAVPAYYLKILVLNLDPRGSTTTRVYSLGGSEEIGTDRFRVLDGPDSGKFVLSSPDFALVYAGGTLRLVPAMAPGAAVATPSPLEEQAYVAAMKSDLRNLVTAEEAFFADSVKYTATIGPGGVNYAVSAGNTFPRITLTRDGWFAVIGNARTRTTCGIFIGSTPQPPARKEGEPACR